MNTTKNQNGFTLIEMMIVVAIIAIMSAMLAPTLFNQVSKAEKARTASDIRLIAVSYTHLTLPTNREV